MTTNEKSSKNNTSIESSSTRQHRPIRTRMVQNFLLIWLDGNIDEINNDDFLNSMNKLRQVVNKVKTFTDVDECVEYIDGIKQEKIFMIFPGALSETTVPIIHDKPQINIFDAQLCSTYNGNQFNC